MLWNHQICGLGLAYLAKQIRKISLFLYSVDFTFSSELPDTFYSLFYFWNISDFGQVGLIQPKTISGVLADPIM